MIGSRISNHSSQNFRQIANAISEYSSTVSELGKMGTALSSAVLTGNVLGAVMGLVSMFGPSTDQLILGELHADFPHISRIVAYRRILPDVSGQRERKIT
jgi:hypothetical protein